MKCNYKESPKILVSPRSLQETRWFHKISHVDKRYIHAHLHVYLNRKHLRFNFRSLVVISWALKIGSIRKEKRSIFKNFDVNTKVSVTYTSSVISSESWGEYNPSKLKITKTFQISSTISKNSVIYIVLCFIFTYYFYFIFLIIFLFFLCFVNDLEKKWF